MTRTPLLIVGDGPAEPTGLGRIARDLVSQILQHDLPFDVVQVGGHAIPVWTHWRHVPLDRGEDWGAAQVEQIYRSIWGDQPGVLFVVWDPSRLWAFTQIDLPVQRWGYCAIDGENLAGGVGGPARAAVEQCDRVLAYNRYGAGVISRTLGRPVSWLPHGISAQTYAAEYHPGIAKELLGPHAIGRTILGSVMTNQARKDHGLLFQATKILIDRGWPLHLWLHTDVLVKDWSIQQLTEDCGLAKRVTITGLQPLPDQSLAALYQASQVVALPTLGEGFGYPIVEALASGTPVVHSRCAGGEGYVPRVEWKVPVRDWHLESCYNIKRPIMHAEDWANAIERALRWRQQEDPRVVRAYCQGAVQHLDWGALWGRWQAWFKQGVGA